MYSFWYNAPKLLPTGDTAEMELLRMGEFVAQNKYG
jgi:hypothetical protein